jgi:hypothetical protein
MHYRTYFRLLAEFADARAAHRSKELALRRKTVRELGKFMESAFEVLAEPSPEREAAGQFGLHSPEPEVDRERNRYQQMRVESGFDALEGFVQNEVALAHEDADLGTGVTRESRRKARGLARNPELPPLLAEVDRLADGPPSSTRTPSPSLAEALIEALESGLD